METPKGFVAQITADGGYRWKGISRSLVTCTWDGKLHQIEYCAVSSKRKALKIIDRHQEENKAWEVVWNGESQIQIKRD